MNNKKRPTFFAPMPNSTPAFFSCSESNKIEF